MHTNPIPVFLHRAVAPEDLGSLAKARKDAEGQCWEVSQYSIQYNCSGSSVISTSLIPDAWLFHQRPSIDTTDQREYSLIVANATAWLPFATGILAGGQGAVELTTPIIAQ